MEHFKKFLNFRTSAGAGRHIISKFGVSGRNWVKLGEIGTNLGVIGRNLEKKGTKYAINRSGRPSGGAAPLRRPKRSLNTHPLLAWGYLTMFWRLCGALVPKKWQKKVQKGAFARQTVIKNGQKWAFAEQRRLNWATKGTFVVTNGQNWYTITNLTALRSEYAS